MHIYETAHLSIYMYCTAHAYNVYIAGVEEKKKNKKKRSVIYYVITHVVFVLKSYIYVQNFYTSLRPRGTYLCIRSIVLRTRNRVKREVVVIIFIVIASSPRR